MTSPNRTKPDQDKILYTTDVGSDVARLIAQARAAGRPEISNEIASAFDLARKKGEE